MEGCVFFLGDNCVTGNDLILWVFVLGLFFIVLGVFLYRYWNSDENSDEIKTVNMNFQKSVPDGDSANIAGADYEEDLPDYPFKVGTTFFAGEENRLGVKLEVLRYRDDDNEIVLKMWVETPVGATNITTSHDMDTDYSLGTATVRYELNGSAVTVLINMSNDELDECGYRVVIVMHQSTNEDITG